MEEERHHEELIAGISEQLKPVMDKSPQAIYVYLDDAHKFCNKRFATMVGYGSAKEWNNMEAPLADIVEADQERVVNAYMKASRDLVASRVEARITHVKTGEAFNAEIMMTPIAFGGHVMVMHFINRA